ncbi:MAG: anthranilate phosphoribosyltransferase [Salinirussus sp.]
MSDRPLRTLLTEVMGSGPKTADDMTYEQARNAFDHILDGNADPVTLGGFLLAARWKVNTPTELAGFLDALRDRATLSSPEVQPVDCGANYDGKTETAILGVAAGLVAASAGVPIAVHAGRRLPASHGDTYRNVLEALDVETSLTPSASAQVLDEAGFALYNQSHFLPALDALRDVRTSMGVRTPLNTVETLVNPANASVHLGSFFHLSYGERIARTVAESHSLPVERVVLLQGLEGYDDVRPGRTTMVEWRCGDEIAERQLEARKHGIEFDRSTLGVADIAADSAAITESILAGERDGPIADAVVLNAAIRIYAGGATNSIAEALEFARERLDAGAARERLSILRDAESTETVTPRNHP